jgi:tRNA threonylcarbamoyladenosine biosynthesis protein TsaB
VPEHESAVVMPAAAAVVRLREWGRLEPVALTSWEPEYGRLAEAQVVWERTHGQALPV